MFSRGLLALQGPQASAVLGRFVPQVATMKFMTGAFFVIEGARCYVTRSGYTGCDGYEISTPVDATDPIARKLLGHPEVKPIGLGARDTLRLEMGFCLYGNDIDKTTNPLEAGLGWITKLDKENFVGKESLLQKKQNGLERKLVGFVVNEEKAFPRHGYELRSNGKSIGNVTSGTVSPTLEKGIGLGYVGAQHAQPDSSLLVTIRNKDVSATIVKIPFIKK